MVAFRGTKNGLVIQLGNEPDFAAVISRLVEKVKANARFFEGAQVTVDPGNRDLDDAQQEQIMAILHEHGLKLVGVAPRSTETQNTTEQMKQASSLSAASFAEVGAGALVVPRTLRSGQIIRHNGDVIVLGDLNPGAEVVASGHIVVMGALRGVAHAGATGNGQAIVAASKLRPTQLRIAGVIGRAPDQGDSGEPVPEVARVRDGMIVIETPS